jgi:flagella basal body P-ring formation protein FlgA
MKRLRLLPLLAASLAMAPAMAGEIRIALKSEAWVAQRQVKLGEIATVAGSDSAAQYAIESMVIATAPRVGYVDRLTREDITARLRSLQPSLGEHLAWEGAAAVSIRADAASLEGTRLAAAAVAQVEAAFAGRFDRLVARPASEMADIAIPRGEVALHPQAIAANTRATKRVPVRIDIHVDGVFVRSVVVAVEIEASARALVARAPISAGREIHGEDFETVAMDVTQLRGEPAAADVVLAGQRVKRSLAAGEALLRDAVEMRPAVARGETVTLRLSSPAIEVQARAVVLADAAVGEAVWIKRESAGDAMRALVVAPGIVEVTSR